MSKLLFEVEHYHGEGMAAALFYEAKVTEAVALVVDAWKRQSKKRERPLSAEDAASLQNVVNYIADHYAFDIPLERLANIACMSETKLKSCFKRQFGCSVTQYIQPLRGAVQKEYRHFADRVSEDRTQRSGNMNTTAIFFRPKLYFGSGFIQQDKDPDPSAYRAGELSPFETSRFPKALRKKRA